MKRALTFFVLPMLSLAAACGDDDDGGAADAGPSIDGAATIDASAADADLRPDANPLLPDAGMGTATITILGAADAPLPGIDVAFNAPDGSSISAMQTDSAGQASENITSGSMITVATVQGSGIASYNLFSIGDVQPGDSIVIRNFGVAGTQPGIADSINVNWNGTFTGADTYVATDGCNDAMTMNPAQSTSFDVEDTCLNASGNTFDIVAQAVDTSGLFDSAVAHAFVLDEATGGSPNLNLPAWSDQFDTIATTVANEPAGGLVFGGATFYKDGKEFDIADDSLATGSYNGRVPMGITPESVSLVSGAILLSGMNPTGIVVHTVNINGLPTTASVDFADGTRVATDGIYDTTTDPARPSASWTASGTAVAADMTQVVFSWTAASGDSHTWVLITNPNFHGPAQLPEMPTALAAYAADATSTHDDPFVLYLGASWMDEGWDALRQTAGVSANQQPASDFTYSVSFPAFAPAPLNAEPLWGARELLARRDAIIHFALGLTAR